VRCINISNALLPEGVSPQVLTALGERLLRCEQSLVFINRRLCAGADVHRLRLAVRLPQLRGQDGAAP